MTPASLLAQLVPTVETARAVGSSDSTTLLAGALIAVVGLAVFLGRALIAEKEARRADTERLLAVQVKREGDVVTAMGAITRLPDAIDAVPEATAMAVREMIRGERISEMGARRGGR